jgi:glutamate-1-semialdehyde 2,1-aminomutase
MFGVMFAERLPDDYRGWASTDHVLYDDVAVRMFARGAMPEPDSREPWFLCEAHGEGNLVDRVVTAFEGALGDALAARAGQAAAGIRATAG